MIPRILLLSVVLSNLAPLAVGHLVYNLINKCADPIDVFFHPSGGVSAIAFNIPSLGESGYHVQEVNSGYFYTTANGGIEATATRAGFHADGDGYGNSFSYYVVKDVNNFNTGISITPLITRPPDGGYCDAARCEDVSCAFAFSKQPTSPANLPRPRVGVVPTPPLYLCPFSRVEVAYDITFCPSYNWPHESAPVRIHPESFPDKCLRVRDAIYANGTPVDIVNCESGRVSQQWYINRGSTQIRAAGADKAFCLDAGSGPASGVPMKIWQCYDNLAAQKWYRYPIGVVDHDRIALVGKEQCLDLTNGQVWNGNRVQTWQCSQGNPNQAWSVTDA